MSLLMIHEAYMPVYIGSRFSLRAGARVRGSTRGSTRGPRGPKKKLVLKWTWDQLFRLSLGKKTKKNNFTWHGWQKAKGMTIFWAVIHFHHHHHRLWSKSLVMFSNSWSHELEIWLHKASQSWLLGETDVWILKEDSMPKSANPLSIILIKNWRGKVMSGSV